MTAEGTVPKIDGDVLFASDYNNTFRANLLFAQTIEGTVTVGDPVIYDITSSRWVKSGSTATPLGMMSGTTEIATSGYVSGLTGLSAGQFYYDDGDGTISTTPSTCKIGMAISATELLLDIDSTTYLNAGIGVFGSGASSNTTMDYITIASLGNATAFATVGAHYGQSACASSVRGIFAGDSSDTTLIEYMAFITKAALTDFGDAAVSVFYSAALSSNTRGCFGGGNTELDSISYITIATTGNTTDFGNLTVGRGWTPAGCASTTRGCYGGGEDSGGSSNVIDYITIATTGNATDFGDLTDARDNTSACSSSTRGIWGGGNFAAKNTIDYITIASTGNATDFGDLLAATSFLAACSSELRGVFGGGDNSTDVLQYVTIASTGNATDFGDLTVARQILAACSNSHGGL